MRRFSVSLLIAALVSAGVAWRLWIDVARGPDRSLLIAEGGAAWAMADAPFLPFIRQMEHRKHAFRRRFSLEQAPRRAQLEIRSFRSHWLRVNGTWLSGAAAIEIAPYLETGENEIIIVVDNDRGRPALLAYSPELGLATPAAWQGSQNLKSWTSAVPLTARRSLGLSRRFENTLASLGGKLLPLFALFLLGALGSRFVSRPTAPARFRWVLLAAWVLLCGNNLFRLPLEVGFDVGEHYAYVDYILTQRALPLPGERLETYQSPLFYLIAAAVSWLASLGLEAEAVRRALRVLPMLCGLAQLEISFRTSRLVFPDRGDLQIAGTAIGGFLPVNVYLSQAVGNEPLAGCLTALAILECLRLLSAPARRSLVIDAGRLGLIFGLAMLSKASAVLLLPLLMLLLVYLADLRGVRTRELWQAIGALLLVGALVCGAYYLRNWIRLGALFVGGWDPARGTPWWQAPGFRIPSDFLRFGVSLTQPIYAALAGFWDGVYSTFWLDGFLSGIWNPAYAPPWNYGFMLSMAPLSLPLALAGVAGAGLALRAGDARPAKLFALACVAVYLAGLATMFLSVPNYSTFKSSFMIGALPAYVVLITSGLESLPRGRLSRAILWGYLASWLGFGYLAYFAI